MVDTAHPAPAGDRRAAVGTVADLDVVVAGDAVGDAVFGRDSPAPVSALGCSDPDLPVQEDPADDAEGRNHTDRPQREQQ